MVELCCCCLSNLAVCQTLCNVKTFFCFSKCRRVDSGYDNLWLFSEWLRQLFNRKKSNSHLAPWSVIDSVWVHQWYTIPCFPGSSMCGFYYCFSLCRHHGADCLSICSGCWISGQCFRHLSHQESEVPADPAHAAYGSAWRDLEAAWICCLCPQQGDLGVLLIFFFYLQSWLRALFMKPFMMIIWWWV